MKELPTLEWSQCLHFQGRRLFDPEDKGKKIIRKVYQPTYQKLPEDLNVQWHSKNLRTCRNSKRFLKSPCPRTDHRHVSLSQHAKVAYDVGPYSVRQKCQQRNLKMCRVHCECWRLSVTVAILTSILVNFVRLRNLIGLIKTKCKIGGSYI